MVKKENIKDKIIDVIFISEKLSSPDVNTFFIPYILTTPKVGIDKRNDILAESTLLKFDILAAVITIPDLLTPGIRDNV